MAGCAGVADLGRPGVAAGRPVGGGTAAVLGGCRAGTAEQPLEQSAMRAQAGLLPGRGVSRYTKSRRLLAL